MFSNWRSQRSVRKRLEEESFPLARKRAGTLPTRSLIEATDAHLYYVAQGVGQWRRGGGEEALDATETNILALLEIVRELRTRGTATPRVGL